MTERKINWQRFLKWSLYTGILLMLFTVQTARGVLPALPGARINFIPFFVASIAIYESPMSAAIMGLAAGMLCDAGQVGPDGLFLSWYTLSGALCGYLVKRYFRKIMPVCLILGGSMLFIQGCASYLFYYSMLPGVTLQRGAMLILGDLFVSSALSPVPYYLVKRIWAAYTPEESEE